MPTCPKCFSNSVVGSYCGECGARVDLPLSENKSECGQQQKTYTKNDLTLCEQAVKQAPNNPKAYLSLINTALELGLTAQAYSAFRAAKALFAENQELLKIGARVLEAMGRKTEAIECLTKASCYDETDKDTVFKLVTLLIERGKKESALTELEKLYKACPKEPSVLLRLSRLNLELKNAENARKYLFKYRQSAGATLEMYLLLGQTMLAEGFYDGAVKNYTEGKSAFKNNSQLSLGLGKAYLGMKENQKALEEFKDALSKDENNTEALFELAKLQKEMGAGDADQTIEKLKTSAYAKGEDFLRLGEYFISQGLLAKAEECLQRGLELSPCAEEIQKKLSEAYVLQKNYQKATELYKSVLEGFNNRLWAHEGIINCALKTKNYALMADSQLKLLEASQPDAQKWCDYGETLIKLGRFGDAKTAFEKAAKLDPACIRAYQAPELIKSEKLLAEGKKFVEQAKEAIEKKFFLTAENHLKKALELVPGQTEWLKMLGDTACKTADTAKALNIFERLCKNEPEDINLMLKLARLYEYEEKPQKAIETLECAVKRQPSCIKAYISLFKLKRTQLRALQINRQTLNDINESLEASLESIKRNSPVLQTVKAYAGIIYSFGTKYHKETLNTAEQLFNTVLSRFEGFKPAVYGRFLCARAKNDIEKAAEYAKTLEESANEPDELFYLARFYENFRQCSKALHYYKTLSDKFEENGFYRQKKVEMLLLSFENNKLKGAADFIAQKQDQAQNGAKWALFELAAARNAMLNDSQTNAENIKKALLSLNKAASAQPNNPWPRLEALKCRIKYAKEAELKRIASSNIKTVEKILREMPDNHEGFLAIGRCCLAYGDLLNTDKALRYLKNACFLAPNCAEAIMLTAKTAKKLGRLFIVDAMAYNMLLLEPELCTLCF